MPWSCDGRVHKVGLGRCEDTIDGPWEVGESSRQEDGRVSEEYGPHKRNTPPPPFHPFGINCKSVQVVFTHMDDGMDHFVG